MSTFQAVVSPSSSTPHSSYSSNRIHFSFSCSQRNRKRPSSFPAHVKIRRIPSLGIREIIIRRTHSHDRSRIRHKCNSIPSLRWHPSSQSSHPLTYRRKYFTPPILMHKLIRWSFYLLYSDLKRTVRFFSSGLRS